MLSKRCLPASILLLLLFAALSSSLPEILYCDSNLTLPVIQPNDEVGFVKSEMLMFWYDRDSMAVYRNYDSDKVDVLLTKDALVSLRGYLFLPSFDDYVKRKTIAFSAHLTKNTDGTEVLSDCELYSSKNSTEEEGKLSHRFIDEEWRQSAKCIGTEICKSKLLSTVTKRDYLRAENHPFDFGPLKTVDAKSYELNQDIKSMDPATLMKMVQLQTNNVDLQSVINMIVDLIIREIRRKIKEESNGFINLPDIQENFVAESAFLPDGEFDAINGIFSDLTTISRIGDAHLEHKGLNFTASCGFGLSKANVHYAKYKLKYGVKVSGELSADVNGIELQMVVGVDYSQKPCKLSLKDLQITDLGQLNVTITGLSPLNGLASKLVTWITKHYEEEVITRVQKTVADVVEEHLSEFDCEKYRP